MEMIIFMILLIIWGAWTKRQNTLHMRRLARECWERHMYDNRQPPYPQNGKANPLPLFHRRAR